MNASPSSPNDAAYCAFCGLPLPPALGGTAAGDAVDYCCSGCRVASDVQAATVDDDSRRPLFRLGLGVFFTMNVMVFSMALWSQDFYRAEDFQTPLAQSVRSVFRWGSLLFSAPVLFLLGEPIVAGVWHAMRRRAVTTDLLILLGVAAAYAYSVVSVLRSEGHVYFETGCVVLVFVSLGRLLEARGKRQTSAALDELSRLLPDAVRLVLADGEQREVPRSEVRRGDVLRALPGERLAVDGRIVAGAAAFDEQTVTGESRYAAKRVGDPVYSGTLNVDGDLRIEVTAAAGEETVSRMLALVRDARRAKGRHQRLADAIAAWFVPLVAVIVVVAGTWQGRLHGLDYGILTALAVTLIACPCALGLATPMAVWTALGRAARGQTLFRSGAVLERLATVRAAALDKTGTLTSGEPTVRTALVSRGENRVAALQTVAALAAGSMHALSRAAVGYVGELLRNAPAGCNATGLRTDLAVETLGGRGLVLRDDTGRIEEWLGNERLAREAGATVPDDLIEALAEADAGDATLAYFGWGSHVRGVLVFDEQLRPATRLALTEFRQLGVDPIVLTGDRFARAARIADDLGVAVRAELLPEQKVAALAELRAGVEPDGTVAMIGDGLNDAPALAAADVGIALGCGAELSRDAAGVCLLGDDLRRAAWAIALARRTVRTIRQNLFWAFVYNAGGMALAATGKLAPVWAALAMAASSLIVIGNSLRLSRFPEPEPFEPPQLAASATTPAEAESQPQETPSSASPTTTRRAASDFAASAPPRP
ncbi:MAG: cation-translocating P-type ATPase [Pirellulales bacterium]|nr:cation-translocating P-type ATPase [Pirellulales bacterium]